MFAQTAIKTQPNCNAVKRPQQSAGVEARLVTSSQHAPVHCHCDLPALQRATFSQTHILPQQPSRNKGWTKNDFKATAVLSASSRGLFACGGFCLCRSFDGVTLLWFILVEQEIKKEAIVFVHIYYIEMFAFAWLKSYLFYFFLSFKPLKW